MSFDFLFLFYFVAIINSALYHPDLSLAKRYGDFFLFFLNLKTK